MPHLDGVGITAIASFAALVVAWLIAPNTTVEPARAEIAAAA